VELGAALRGCRSTTGRRSGINGIPTKDYCQHVGMPFVGLTGGSVGYGRAAGDISPTTTGLQVWLAPNTATGGTWTDLQGSTNATLNNTPTTGSRGITLNGTTQYGSLASVSGKTDFTVSQSYSVEVWINIAATQNDTATADNDIVEKWNSSNQAAYPYVIRYLRPSGTIFIATYNGSINPGVGFAVPTNTWMQIVGVFDRANNLINGYRNGVFNSSASLLNISGTTNNSSTLELGRRAGVGGASGNNYFTGSIGLLRIYSGALTAAQVLQNFNADRGKFGL
jgi:hypothetical protein